MREPRHSMDSPEWYSPPAVVGLARLTMGGIDLDPASHAEANAVHGIPRYFTPEDDGLRWSWPGRVFVNAPGGLVDEFWIKFVEEHLSGRMEQGFWVGYSLEQLQTLQKVSAKMLPWDFSMCYLRERIRFVENEAKKAERHARLRGLGKKIVQRSQPSHGNYIVYAGARARQFAELFCELGRVEIH